MKEILFKKEESEYLKKILSGMSDKKSKSLIGKLERAEKKIKTSSAKGKGRNLQYWVCEKIANMFGIKFDQQDDNCPIHSREMGLNGVDVVLRSPIYEQFPFDIECKCCENLSIPDWVRQARANNKKDRYWMVVFKKQTIGGEPLVLIDWSTFEKIIKK